jgi:hypothetical protein
MPKMGKAAPATSSTGRTAGLYIRRELTAESGAKFAAWAQAQGFENPLPTKDLHSTIVYSHTPIDLWARGGEVAVVGGARTVKPLGDKGAVALTFESKVLSARRDEAVRLGASHDFQTFTPHVTITWDKGGLDLAQVTPYEGDLIFGPEIHAPIDEDWTPPVGKAAGDEPDEDAEIAATAKAIAAGVDLTPMDGLPEALEDPLAAVAEAGGNLTLVQVGVDNYSQLTGQVAQRALVFARARAAELVGRKWVDGELVDNPNPVWAITDSTRSMLERTIVESLQQNRSVPSMADRIAALKDAVTGAYAFSEDRADLIAHTEVRRANTEGALDGAREAQDAGVTVQKVWLVGQNPCEICLDNEADGPIDLDDSFSSGEDGPPAHPGCFCSLSWELPSGAETDEEGD